MGLEHYNDYFKGITGDQLGVGCFRKVARHSGDPEQIIKTAYSPVSTFHNWMEFWVWHSAPEHIQYRLAPVYGISEDGRHLLMARVSQVHVPDGYAGLPRRVTKYFRDLGKRNCGWLGVGRHRRLVICDYALPIFPQWKMSGGVAPQTWGIQDGLIREAAQYTQA